MWSPKNRSNNNIEQVIETRNVKLIKETCVSNKTKKRKRNATHAHTHTTTKQKGKQHNKTHEKRQ